MGLSNEDINGLKDDVTSLKEQSKTLFNIVGELKTDIKEIKQQLANRLPIWATALIALLTAVCGWLAAK